MKEGFDNIRASAMQGVMKRLKAKGVKLIVCGPRIDQTELYQSEVLHDLARVKQSSDVIIAYCKDADLDGKVFTRDLFGGDD